METSFQVQSSISKVKIRISVPRGLSIYNSTVEKGPRHRVKLYRRNQAVVNAKKELDKYLYFF